MHSSKNSLSTRCAHASTCLTPNEVSPASYIAPIEQTALFELESSDNAEALFSGNKSGYIYTRFGNPTVDHLADFIAQMEGGSGGLITSSGNAATLCALTSALRGKDDCIVSHPDVYGGTQELLSIFSERYHVPVVMADPQETGEWQAAIARASIVYIETPSNPLLKLIDLKETAQLSHAAGAQLIVDNTVATPYNQQPFLFGADWIVHSISKYLNGHSDMIGGCLISRVPITPTHRAIHKNLGGTVNALDAWLVLRGLRSFALRMEAHNTNGMAIAKWLEIHPAVIKVYYPGLFTHPQSALFKTQMRGGGGLLSFELSGGEDAAKRFLDRLKIIVHAVSLGGMESLATRPAATSHRGISPQLRQLAGISDSLIRLSAGVESLDDLYADLSGALE